MQHAVGGEGDALRARPSRTRNTVPVRSPTRYNSLGAGGGGSRRIETGETLSRTVLSGARVIARGERIRDVRRLVAQYGGRASRWVKKSSAPFELAGERFEYHWYEHHGVGRFETRKVRVG